MTIPIVHIVTLFLGIVAAVLCPRPASAADGIVTGLPYYESLRNLSCTATTTCQLSFATVPSGFVLQATNLNCRLTSNVDLSAADLQLFQGPRTASVSKNLFALDGGPRVFHLNDVILSFFASGTVPMTNVTKREAASTFVVTCKLSGNLAKPS